MAGTRPEGATRVLFGVVLLALVGLGGFGIGVLTAGDNATAQTTSAPLQSEEAPESDAGSSAESTGTTGEPATTAGPITTNVTEPTTTALSEDERVYRLAGGVVTVSFADEQAVILSAEPAEGFTAETLETDDSGVVEVNFRQGAAHSNLQAWYDGGPQIRLDDH